MRSEKARKVSTVVSAVSEVSTLITAVTSVHLPKPVSTDLTIMPDSVLINPIGKENVVTNNVTTPNREKPYCLLPWSCFYCLNLITGDPM